MGCCCLLKVDFNLFIYFFCVFLLLSWNIMEPRSELSSLSNETVVLIIFLSSPFTTIFFFKFFSVYGKDFESRFLLKSIVISVWLKDALFLSITTCLFEISLASSYVNTYIGILRLNCIQVEGDIFKVLFLPSYCFF